MGNSSSTKRKTRRTKRGGTHSNQNLKNTHHSYAATVAPSTTTNNNTRSHNNNPLLVAQTAAPPQSAPITITTAAAASTRPEPHAASLTASSSDTDDELESKSEETVKPSSTASVSTKPVTNIVTKLSRSQRQQLDTDGLNKLLVDGFIRRIQCTLTDNIFIYHVIPEPIVNLCFDFYVLTRTLIYFVSQELTKNPNGLYLCDTESEDKKHWKAEIMNLQLGHVVTEMLKDEWLFDDCGVCLTKSFDRFPRHISNLLDKSYNIHFNKHCNDVDVLQHGTYFKRKYDVIFQCSSYFSCAIILDNRQYHTESTMQKIYGWQWNFDRLEFGSSGNFALYSARHGLLSVGGARRNCFFQLDFTKFENEYKVHWDSLPGMLKNRGRTSCALIDCMSNGDQAEKLIVVNGVDNDYGDYLNAVEIYDFESREWDELKACNFSRECAGICYDRTCQQIYVGGGVCDFTAKYAQNKLEFYDIHKDEWYELSDLQMEHSYYPVMYKSIKNPKLLYIASCSSNALELYDLRSDKTYIQHDFTELMHTQITKYSRMNRLLK